MPQMPVDIVKGLSDSMAAELSAKLGFTGELAGLVRCGLSSESLFALPGAVSRVALGRVRRRQCFPGLWVMTLFRVCLGCVWCV